MIVESIALFILLLSLGVLAFILRKKLPVLLQLPEVHEGIQKEGIVSRIKNRFKTLSPDKNITLKTLSKVRVYVLKIEKQLDSLLQKTRKNIHTKSKGGKNEPPSMPK